MTNPKFDGFYRGIVVNNVDPEYKGRIQVYIPGVYPETFKSNLKVLPWAEPAMSIFGGSYENKSVADKSLSNKETGMTSSPHTGANVWVFFEAGDHMLPIYCFAMQSGTGWLSEHEDQHVIQTNNVRITIDDNTSSEKITRKYDSNNSNNVLSSKGKSKTDMIPTIDISVEGMANIVVNGDVNCFVKGDYFMEVKGDSHETVHGNKYVKVKGESESEFVGAVIRKYKNNTNDYYTSSHTIVVSGDKLESVTGNFSTFVGGTHSLMIADGQVVTTSYRNVTIAGDHTIACAGTTNDTTFANRSITTGGLRYDEVNLDYSISATLLRLN